MCKLKVYMNMNRFMIITEEVFNSNMSANAKLLYALISSLSNNNGYCFASNDYLKDKMKLKSIRAVQLLLNELKDNHFIKIDRIGNSRQIYLIVDSEKTKRLDYLIEKNKNC